MLVRLVGVLPSIERPSRMSLRHPSFYRDTNHRSSIEILRSPSLLPGERFMIVTGLSHMSAFAYS